MGDRPMTRRMTKRFQITINSLKTMSHSDIPAKLSSLERSGELFQIAQCVPESHEASTLLATLLTRGAPSASLKKSLKRRDLMKRLMEKVCSSYVLTDDITFCYILLHSLGPDESFIQWNILEHILVVAYFTWSTSTPSYQLRCICLSLQGFFKVDMVVDYIKSETGVSALTMFTEMSTFHDGFATAAVRLLERDSNHSIKTFMRGLGVVRKLVGRLLSSGASLTCPGMLFMKSLSFESDGHLDWGLLGDVALETSSLTIINEDVRGFLVDELRSAFIPPYNIRQMTGDAAMVLASRVGYRPGEDPKVVEILMHDCAIRSMESFPTEFVDQVRETLERLMTTGSLPGYSFLVLAKAVGARSEAELKRLQEREQKMSALGMEFPLEFQCPITLNSMEDPVVASDGHTYERCAILKVLQGSETPKSPMTREVLLPQVFPNRNLKTSILEYEGRILLAHDRGGASVCGGTHHHECSQT